MSAESLTDVNIAGDLVIVDPYLFPTRPKLGDAAYASFLAALGAPILEAARA